MDCTVVFPTAPRWVSADVFESILRANPVRPHDASRTTFVFPRGCRVMIDAAVRLLSLANQLDSVGQRVSLLFEDGYDGVMGYLDRMSFFQFVAAGVDIEPPRSNWRNVAFVGGNPDLVEISRIAKEGADASLRDKLHDSIKHSCASRPDVDQLADAVWTIFSELFDNISQHSETPLDAFAALQAYKGGQSVRIAVPDSGKGILKTLRPALELKAPRLSRKSDAEVLLEVFREGLSRFHRPERGCGLKGCATKAIRFHATLEVRLLRSRVVLRPARNGYELAAAKCFDDLPAIWGTHLTFDLNPSTV